MSEDEIGNDKCQIEASENQYEDNQSYLHRKLLITKHITKMQRQLTSRKFQTKLLDVINTQGKQ